MKYRVGKWMLCIVGLCFLCGCGNTSDPGTESETESGSEEAVSSVSSEEFAITEADLQAFYEAYIEKEGQDLEYRNGKWAMYDVDGDSIKELIITAPSGLLSVIRYQAGEAIVMYEDKYSTLLENGMIRYYSFDGAPQHERYVFYTPADGEYREAAQMNRYDTEEDEYSRIFGENDLYELRIREEGAFQEGKNITMEDWKDVLDEYLEYPRAELTFQGMIGEEENLLTFQTETEAYQAFLNGECGVVLSDSYTDDISYLVPCLTEGEEYTLYDILNRLNNEPLRYEAENGYGFHYNNYGTDVSYAYIDCGQDGRKELALKICQKSLDGFQGIYIIQYRDNHLYLCYGIDSWSRRSVVMNPYGYIWEAGSSGANLHGGMQVLVDGEGNSYKIAEYIIDSEYAYDFTYSFAGDYPTVDILHETEQAWMEDYDINTHPLEDLCIEMDIIDGKDYYTYGYSSNIKNVESFIQSCEAAGVTFSSYSEVEAALQARREEFGAVAIAENKSEIIWMEVIFPEDE